MLALPQTPQALVVMKMRCEAWRHRQAGPQRDIGDVAD